MIVWTFSTCWCLSPALSMGFHLSEKVIFLHGAPSWSLRRLLSEDALVITSSQTLVLLLQCWRAVCTAHLLSWSKIHFIKIIIIIIWNVPSSVSERYHDLTTEFPPAPLFSCEFLYAQNAGRCCAVFSAGGYYCAMFFSLILAHA